MKMISQDFSTFHNGLTVQVGSHRQNIQLLNGLYFDLKVYLPVQFKLDGFLFLRIIFLMSCLNKSNFRNSKVELSLSLVWLRLVGEPEHFAF